MPNTKQKIWYETGQPSVDLACTHCQGVTRHEPWCKTQNLSVYYAFYVVSHPDRLTVQDTLILHALGVTWDAAKH